MIKNKNLTEQFDQDISTDIVVRMHEAVKITSLSKSTLNAMTSQGLFVPKIQLGERACGYSLSSIRKWLSTRTKTNS
jgi:predicted DNA-binding transcriptional regulator AlpA